MDSGIDVPTSSVAIGATYCISDDLGLFAELGLNYGSTGISNGKFEFHFGTVFAIAFGVGVRYP